MANQEPRTSIDVLVLPGDGIGPEVIAAAVAVLQTAARHGGLELTLHEALLGGAAVDAEGRPVSESTLEQAKQADAVLLGAVGGPRWDDVDKALRPEAGLLTLREALAVYANLRPVRVLPGLEDASALRPESVHGLDLVIVRELVGGIYFGTPRERTGKPGDRRALNTMVYHEDEIRRVARRAFELAQARDGRLVSVDKANVLEVSVLWREVVTELAAEYPDVALTHQYVDNCAMQLVLAPQQFDVLVTGNLFGDILSDAAAAVTGSLGMLPSASLGEGAALYEPVHGSAPELAGRDRANPLAAILSVALLLEHTAGRPDLSRAVEAAVIAVLADGLRTPDLWPDSAGATGDDVGTAALGAAVVAALERALDDPARAAGPEEA